MRAFTFVFALAASQLLSLVPVDAKPARKALRTSPSAELYGALPHANAFATRQHHEPRALLDVCAYIDTDSVLGGLILGIPLHELLGLKLCLCLSALPLDLEASAQLRLLGEKYGSSLVNAALELLINTSHKSKHCRYPPHSTPLCSPHDPCGFTCDAPYTECDGECVCKPPYSMCNGKCGMFPKGCGSAVPQALNGRSLYKRKSSCASFETVCGVYGSTNKDAFECINTQSNLESCGGCVYSFGGVQTPTGKDCSAIEGASGVSCVAGSCLVSSCAEGWSVNENQDGCVAGVGVRIQKVAQRVQPVTPQVVRGERKGEPVEGDISL